MRYVQGIGVTSSTSRVYAKFDALQIRGFRYPIDSIYKLTREEARNLTSRKPRPRPASRRRRAPSRRRRIPRRVDAEFHDSFRGM